MIGGAPIRRAFLAVVPPAPVLDAVAAFVDRLRTDDDGLRWAARTQWHTTLQFLGRVEHAGAVVTAMGEAVRSSAPFPTRLGGGGAFPKAVRGTLLWLGHDEGGEQLGALGAALGAAGRELGFAPDDRAFRPHVTVARARRPRDLRPLLTEIGAEPVGPEWSVTEVVLFESETLPDGARYTERARLTLGG